MLYIISAQTLIDNLNDNVYEENSSLLRKLSIKDLSFPQLEKIIDLLVEKKIAHVVSTLYIMGPLPKQCGNPMLLKALPKNINKLTGLIHFACCHQDLKEIPEELGYCTELETLNFHNNDINDIDEVPLQLGNCRNLKQVSLSLNPCTISPGLRDSVNIPALHLDWNEYIVVDKMQYIALAKRLPLDLAHRVMLYTNTQTTIDLIGTTVEKALTWLAQKKLTIMPKASTENKMQKTENLSFVQDHETHEGSSKPQKLKK